MSARRILFVSKGADSASTRYRALAFFERLRADGFAPAHLVVDNRIATLCKAVPQISSAAVVVVLRRGFNAISAHGVRRCARRLVFDLDDAVFQRSNGEPSRLRRRRFARMAALSDAVWAGNSYLRDTVQPHNANVQLMPTVLDPTRYIPSRFEWTGHQELVWVGSRSTRKYLELILPVLDSLMGVFPALRLTVVSDFAIKAARLPVRCVPWSPQAEVAMLAAAHIGIAPLPDDPWTRGKCGFKILQYMAAGLPVIASAVGANRDIVLPGVTGFLARDAAEWTAAMHFLLQEPGAMARLGERGRERLMEHYTVERAYPHIRAGIEALVT